MIAWDSITRLGSTDDIPDPTSHVLNIVQGAVEKGWSITYSEQSCHPPGDTNSTTGNVSLITTQPDIRVGSSWKVLMPGGGPPQYSYFLVLYILQDMVVGFWYMSMEDVIRNKRASITRNPKNFSGNNDAAKVTNAKATNGKPTTASTGTEELFHRLEGCPDATTVIVSIFAVSLHAGLFVHPVQIVHPSTLEYFVGKPYRISIASMVPRLHVQFAFNPDT